MAFWLGSLIVVRQLGQKRRASLTDTVDALLSDIQRLTAANADIEDLKDSLHKLLSLGPFSLSSVFDPGLTLYRATNHHTSIPSRIQDLWYPPANRVTAWSRANRPYSAMFYCSSAPTGAFQEVGAKPGTFLVLSTWVSTRRLLLHDLGFTDQVLARAGARRALPDHHRDFYETVLDTPGRKVRDFIALAFTDPTPDHYVLTTAIVEVHLRADELAGILYPSVARTADVDNVALRPGAVRDGLRLTDAKVCRVDTVADRSFGGETICELANSDETGILSWSYPQPGATLPPGGQRALRVGDRYTFQSPGDIEVEGQRYHVEPGYAIEVNGEVVEVRDAQGRAIAPQ
jgi:hypothetical protein